MNWKQVYVQKGTQFYLYWWLENLSYSLKCYPLWKRSKSSGVPLSYILRKQNNKVMIIPLISQNIR